MKEILGIILFFGIALAGVWFIPGLWRTQETKQSGQPSIMELKNVALDIVQQEQNRVEQEVAEGTSAQTVSENQKSDSVASKPTDPAKLVVKVLNGGAAPGSAGKVAQILKTAGFKLTTAGDSKGDYTGVTVYYQSANKADAEVVKVALIKTHPQTMTQAADATKVETGKAPVVVILGK